MPSTKTSTKASKSESAETENTETEAHETESHEGNGATKTRKPREVRVKYAFAEDGDLEVADEVPEQAALPRNTTGLVGRTSQYVQYLQTVMDQYPGKAVKIATFDNSGACKVAVTELRAGARELPKGTTADDWEFEGRRVIVKDENGNDKRVSQLWVKYNG